MLLDIFRNVILHEDDVISNYGGNTIVSIDGAGLLTGKFTVKPTLIFWLFFWFEGITKTDKNIFVWFICK